MSKSFPHQTYSHPNHAPHFSQPHKRNSSNYSLSTEDDIYLPGVSECVQSMSTSESNSVIHKPVSSSDLISKFKPTAQIQKTVRKEAPSGDPFGLAGAHTPGNDFRSDVTDIFRLICNHVFHVLQHKHTTTLVDLVAGLKIFKHIAPREACNILHKIIRDDRRFYISHDRSIALVPDTFVSSQKSSSSPFLSFCSSEDSSAPSQASRTNPRMPNNQNWETVSTSENALPEQIRSFVWLRFHTGRFRGAETTRRIEQALRESSIPHFHVLPILGADTRFCCNTDPVTGDVIWSLSELGAAISPVCEAHVVPSSHAEPHGPILLSSLERLARPRAASAQGNPASAHPDEVLSRVSRMLRFSPAVRGAPEFK
eukprot:gnl/Chilomastix_cuspidata/732.p1 GENE.gnl/Chilomastix_cuspidata/732~~gnl/Chilomastix_cuspidata/732.p1  ORF type:complete len:369 (+),score=72.51 gnl/Chilomastix_cuspidata/732:77-1183(+)